MNEWRTSVWISLIKISRNKIFGSFIFGFLQFCEDIKTRKLGNKTFFFFLFFLVFQPNIRRISHIIIIILILCLQDCAAHWLIFLYFVQIFLGIRLKSYDIVASVAHVVCHQHINISTFYFLFSSFVYPLIRLSVRRVCLYIYTRNLYTRPAPAMIISTSTSTLQLQLTAVRNGKWQHPTELNRMMLLSVLDDVQWYTYIFELWWMYRRKKRQLNITEGFIYFNGIQHVNRENF